MVEKDSVTSSDIPAFVRALGTLALAAATAVVIKWFFSRDPKDKNLEGHVEDPQKKLQNEQLSGCFLLEELPARDTNLHQVSGGGDLKVNCSLEDSQGPGSFKNSTDIPKKRNGELIAKNFCDKMCLYKETRLTLLSSIINNADASPAELQNCYNDLGVAVRPRDNGTSAIENQVSASNLKHKRHHPSIEQSETIQTDEKKASSSGSGQRIDDFDIMCFESKLDNMSPETTPQPKTEIEERKKRNTCNSVIKQLENITDFVSKNNNESNNHILNNEDKCRELTSNPLVSNVDQNNICVPNCHDVSGIKQFSGETINENDIYDCAMGLSSVHSSICKDITEYTTYSKDHPLINQSDKDQKRILNNVGVTDFLTEQLLCIQNGDNDIKIKYDSTIAQSVGGQEPMVNNEEVTELLPGQPYCIPNSDDDTEMKEDPFIHQSDGEQKTILNNEEVTELSPGQPYCIPNSDHDIRNTTPLSKAGLSNGYNLYLQPVQSSVNVQTVNCQASFLEPSHCVTIQTAKENIAEATLRKSELEVPFLLLQNKASLICNDGEQSDFMYPFHLQDPAMNLLGDQNNCQFTTESTLLESNTISTSVSDNRTNETAHDENIDVNSKIAGWHSNIHKAVAPAHVNNMCMDSMHFDTECCTVAPKSQLISTVNLINNEINTKVSNQHTCVAEVQECTCKGYNARTEFVNTNCDPTDDQDCDICLKNTKKQENHCKNDQEFGISKPSPSFQNATSSGESKCIDPYSCEDLQILSFYSELQNSYVCAGEISILCPRDSCNVFTNKHSFISHELSENYDDKSYSHMIEKDEDYCTRGHELGFSNHYSNHHNTGDSKLINPYLRNDDQIPSCDMEFKNWPGVDDAQSLCEREDCTVSTSKCLDFNHRANGNSYLTTSEKQEDHCREDHESELTKPLNHQNIISAETLSSINPYLSEENHIPFCNTELQNSCEQEHCNVTTNKGLDSINEFLIEGESSTETTKDYPGNCSRGHDIDLFQLSTNIQSSGSSSLIVPHSCIDNLKPLLGEMGTHNTKELVGEECDFEDDSEGRTCKDDPFSSYTESPEQDEEGDSSYSILSLTKDQEKSLTANNDTGLCSIDNDDVTSKEIMSTIAESTDLILPDYRSKHSTFKKMPLMTRSCDNILSGEPYQEPSLKNKAQSMLCLLTEYYSSKLPPTENGPVEEVARGSFIRIPKGLQHLDKAMRFQLNLGNCLELLKLARKNSVPELLKAIYTLISDNYLNVLKNSAVYGQLTCIERERILQLRIRGKMSICVVETKSIFGLHKNIGCSEGTSKYKIQLYSLDIESNQWKPVTSIPDEACLKGCSICSMHNYLFIAGGLQTSAGSSTCSKKLFCYNPLTNIWTQLSPMNEGRSQLKLIPLDGYLYAIGGECLHTVEKYDPRTNKWTFVTPLPKGSFAVAHEAAACGGEIYVSGGHLFYRMLKYIPLRDDWEECPCNASKGRSCDMVAVGNTLYRFDMHKDSSVNILKYNTLAKVWSEYTTKFPGSKIPFRCALLDGSIYCLNRETTAKFSMENEKVVFEANIFSNVPTSGVGSPQPVILGLPGSLSQTSV